MSLKIVVLAKQVPDTRNVGKDAMNADGTINRAALPAIFNPEDLNALEQALRLKDTHPGSTVTILTMGPGRAAEIIREGLYRGADNGYLLTDRAFAGADTLATSYALATAIKKIGDYDLIIGGRQAIDGDTAQVGPQVAEKLGLTQITYTEEVLNVDEEARQITVKRHIDGGVETVVGPLPIVLTVNGDLASFFIHVQYFFSISDLSQAQLFCYLRTYLSGITIDSLTTTNNQIIVTDFLDGCSQGI